MFIHFRLLLVMIILATKLPVKSFAQTSDYKNNPEWIKMIDNPASNYFEAIKAYETYWKYHEKPEGEEEKMEINNNHSSGKISDQEKEEAEEKQRADSIKVFTQQELLELENKREMIYQCKRFQSWILEVKSFVQNDGRILNQKERLDIYNKQQKEQSEQNKK